MQALHCLLYSLCLLVLLCEGEGMEQQFFGGFEPKDNPSSYPANSITEAGAAFDFNGKLPSSRIHQTVVATSDFVLVYGGYSRNGTFLGDINLYYMRTQRWSGPIMRKECCNEQQEEVDLIGAGFEADLPYLKTGFEGDYPSARAEHAACTVRMIIDSSPRAVRSEGLEDEDEDEVQEDKYDEKMIVFGGVTENYGYMNDMYIFHPKTLTWQLVDGVSGPNGLPCRRAGHSMAADSSRGLVYLFGGRTSDRNAGSARNIGLSDLWVYSAALYHWTLLANSGTHGNAIPTSRQHTAMALINKDRLYIFGGIQPLNSFAFNDVWVFNIGLNTWVQLFASTGRTYGFNPPPLSHAHLIPVALEETDADTATSGLLVYGGIGGGGSCGGRHCAPLEATLGQIYRFDLKEMTWVAPHAVTGDVLVSQSRATESLGWKYARISTQSQELDPSATTTGLSDRGKMIKTFAWEGVVVLPERGIMYELGGMKAVPAPHGRVQTDSEGKRLDATLQAPLKDSAGGRLYEPYFDSKTGEQVQGSVTIPTNPFWAYPQGFLASQQGWNPLFGEGASAGDVAVEVHFLRAFRTYSLGARDIVMMHETFEYDD